MLDVDVDDDDNYGNIITIIMPCEYPVVLVKYCAFAVKIQRIAVIVIDTFAHNTHTHHSHRLQSNHTRKCKHTNHTVDPDSATFPSNL